MGGLLPAFSYSRRVGFVSFLSVDFLRRFVLWGPGIYVRVYGHYSVFNHPERHLPTYTYDDCSGQATAPAASLFSHREAHSPGRVETVELALLTLPSQVVCPRSDASSPYAPS